ncbi:bacillithiol biosynthesis cysteine-adding enzyme BshC [Bacillus subtilis]|uniref:bacillithiol biosynthesis cysteine-adding enzyme BshC n=1 Tax=Bacillus subtilis TaxID=1423 RepID=UPI000C333BED|nr:bacillithiol biosynthesis cysteine-adding enzyme BshC [Bacillus subtilis]MCA1171883.1 bacillithiol biosynthesis cysteine-adding enzyme BshC [Bacillus subtilis]MCM3058040.1 bacillithiol biosynthesis cysteine-adding enzyme BshC [Bacillus subtilis]MEC0263260.1 bacillithiol biosynthesis cysteine-adding enzyme BshC [Bacillus subtilis]PKF92172.1 bacillithiol biosynthesis cysteine-adding enzyme BshC [Bacillus subtilis]QAW41530.1 bacillithiol biosynthesis cysteine-adding enzyme BshC [Bacillus subti
MQLTELSIKNQNVFVQHYIDGKEEMSSFFDYSIHHKDMWTERLEDLSSRFFAREELAAYLTSYHNKFGSSAMQSAIEKLKDPSSAAVVGGQQAGLLTGPLYTIHKIISIIVLAKQQEKELQVPVIPIFWVAGEDHDLDEINFVHTSEENGPVKKKLPQSYWKKSSAASTSLDQEKCAAWIDDVFAAFEETDHTNTLLDNVKRCLRESVTFTDFFELLIADLFQEEGLVLLNSGDPGIKKLETAMFQKILRENDELARAVSDQQAFMRQAGYKPIIESGKEQANLFYEYEDERFLIEKDNGRFVIKELDLGWTMDELHTHMEEHPERFSNNVVTRPLMQEFLIPTLAFIAGPGEINYWGELKQAFAVMGFKMPPVMPRLNITILERHIEKKLAERNISLQDAIERGTENQRETYFERQIPEEFTAVMDQAKSQIEAIHKTVRQEALKVDQSMEPLLLKNAAFIQDQLQFLERTVTKRIEEKEGYVLKDYERIQNSIKPLLAPQERIWNIMYYLNRYGPKFFTTFKNLPFSFQNQHQVVKL